MSSRSFDPKKYNKAVSINVGMNNTMKECKKMLLLSLFAFQGLRLLSLHGIDLLSKESGVISSIETIEEMSTEEEKLSFLIRATEQTLDNLKKLQVAIQQFKEQEKTCISQSNAKKKPSDALFELSRRAYTLITLIRELELSTYFRKDFIDELDVISRAYRMKSIPSAHMKDE